MDCETLTDNEPKTLLTYESCINRLDKEIVDNKIVNDIDRIINHLKKDLKEICEKNLPYLESISEEPVKVDKCEIKKMLTRTRHITTHDEFKCSGYCYTDTKKRKK